MKNILLVEDDPQITQLLNLHFNPPEYDITSCTKGEDAIERVMHNNFQMIILDIMLPDISGMQVCKKLRQQNCNVPIMMLTSLSEESDKVLALELGADDYITKPFGILELMARTKALLRRSNNDALAKEENSIIVFKDLQIDKDKRKATIRGNRLDLTPKEFDLLSLLAGYPGKSFTRQELLQKIWGFSFQGYEHTITAHINRLRIKIEMDVSEPEYILTSWGVGYRFSE
jgi:DNA-binding response OmpR family regulator